MSYERNHYGKKRGQGKKGFYLSACTALICLMVVGTVYYKTTHPSSNGNTQDELANESVTLPTATPVGNGAISKDGQVADADKNAAKQEASKEASTSLNANSVNEKASEKKAKAEKKKKKTDAKNNVSAMSNGTKQLSFNEEKGLLWPVKGDVIMKYSQTNTVYFKTLAQYKCNPAIEISAKEGTKVVSSAAGTVTDISKSEETGTIVTVDIGSKYSVAYGQLKDVTVTKGQTLKEGDTIGKIASPTKYFTEEGSNLYFQVKQDSKTVDPLLLLR